MLKIGILSDTHGWLNPRIAHYFADCNEIWHAGDIGSLDVLEDLGKIAPVRAVYGNIDGYDIRLSLAETLIFDAENVKVFLTHIGGYPGKYAPGIKKRLQEVKPKIMVCGHSHILKVMFDRNLNLLHINPGAAGKYGFHKISTILTIFINAEQILGLEVIELKD